MANGAVGVAVNTKSQWHNQVEQSAHAGLMGKLKGIVITPTQSTQKATNAALTFEAYFKDAVGRAGSGVPEHSRAGFQARAQELFREILDNSFDPVVRDGLTRGDGRVSDKLVREAVAQANQKAQQALVELQTYALYARQADGGGPRDIRPQPIPRYDNRGGLAAFNVIRAAPQIENMVLRGGGAKGIGNPEALVEMERAGMFKGLQHIVGSSAGALTAIGLACGRSAEQFQTFATSVNMGDLKGKAQDYETRYPTVKVDWRVGLHTAGQALVVLDRASAGPIERYLNEHMNDAAFQARLVDMQARLNAQTPGTGDVAIDRLAALRNQNYEGERTGQMITFGDLKLLHMLDPVQFKELTLTGWDKTNNEETHFSAESTPNMPVAVAGRISMSIPVYFRSVDYDPGDGKGVRTFVDGGVGSNMPTEVITRGLQGQALDQARAQTAVLTFDEKGEAYTVLHGPPDHPGRLGRAMNWAAGKVVGVGAGVVAGNSGYQKTSDQDTQKIHDAGPNAFVVFHGDIGTLDLNASPERVQQAKAMATLKMLEQIERRQDQACAAEFATPDDCYRVLTDVEKQAVRAGGPPAFRLGASGGEDPAYHFEKAVYDMVMTLG